MKKMHILTIFWLLLILVEMHRQGYIICNCTEFRQGEKILMRPFQPVPPEEPQGAEGTESIPVTVMRMLCECEYMLI